MAKIDRVEDLPEWFKLEKYQGVESFGAIEWFECLELRKKTLFESPYYFGEKPASPAYEESYKLWRASHEEWAPKLCVLREDPLRTDIGPEWARVSAWLYHPGNQPLRVITTSDLVSQATHDSFAVEDGLYGRERVLRWTAINSRPLPDECDLDMPLEFDWNAPTFREPSAALFVDMSAPDAVLKKAFDSWLRDARASRQSKERPRRMPLYDRWARYGLLPYLDLLIWSLETETHIPDRVMSAAISPYDAGEANLRKTIAPLAVGLMRDISELEALALLEAAARTSAKLETSEEENFPETSDR